MDSSQHCDVLVIGGGPAGSVVSSVLATKVSVIFVDDSQLRNPSFKIGESLPPQSKPILHEIGVLKRINEIQQLPYVGTLSIWGNDEPTSNSFLFNSSGNGWHLNRMNFDNLLRLNAKEKGARFLDGSITSFERKDGKWIFKYEKFVFKFKINVKKLNYIRDRKQMGCGC